MSPSSKSVLDAALELPVEDRAEIADRLWSSIDPNTDAETEVEWAAELERRVSEIKSGSIRSVPWQQVRAELQRAQDGQAD